jgi:hypothetical protein
MMSEVEKLRDVIVGGKKIEVRELRIAEIREMMEQAQARFMDEEAPRADVLNEVLFEEIGLGDLAHMCSMPIEEMYNQTPSELKKLLDTCMEINGHFFDMMIRLRRYVAITGSESLN